MDESTKVWRYTDLAKFITILSRGLHFSRPAVLGDEWEGTWGVKNILAFRQEYFGRPTEGAAEWERRTAEKRSRLDSVGVSCWHRSDHESAALWDLYMPRGFGVAVQSTIGHILSAATAAGRSLEVLEVEYINFNEAEIPSDSRLLLGRKRHEFRHESEVRFLLPFTEDERTVIDMHTKIYEERDTRWISLSPVNGGLTRPGSAINVNDDTAVNRATRFGAHLPIQANVVIEAIHLSPKIAQPVRYAVLDVVEKYGLDRKLIRESSQDAVAPDRVIFF